jgi:hypothetical protein
MRTLRWVFLLLFISGCTPAPTTHHAIYAPNSGRNMDPEQAAAFLQFLGWFALGILCFGLAILWTGCWMMNKGMVPKRHGLRLYFGTMIFTLSAFLAIAGFGQAEMAWITGLFGAVVGYLFQTAASEKAGTDEDTRPTTPPAPPAP